MVAALRPRVVRPRAPVYGPEVVAALRVCCAVLGAPTGKRVAAVLPDLVARLRRFGELTISDATAALLARMSAGRSTVSWRNDRAAMTLRAGR